MLGRPMALPSSPLRSHAPSRALMVALAATGCGTTADRGPTLDETGGGADGVPPTMNDGMGEGVFRLPVLGERFSLLVGAPLATIDGAERAGLVSVFASEPGQGVVLHSLYHPRIVEDAASSDCVEPQHRFAWQHGADRAFGRSVSWYSEALGADYLDYVNAPVIGAPGAAGGNGMVAQYRGCQSCGSFASSPGSTSLDGDELGTGFGAALGIGVFELANIASPHLWRQNSSEGLAIAAPAWNGSGGVHIYDGSAYRKWFSSTGEELEGTRICDREGAGGSLTPRLRTLTGGFATEEFGRAMVVADFSCDGYDDLAIGAPGADLPMGDGSLLEDAGAVYVFRGGPLGVGNEGSVVLTQGAFGSEGTPEAGDRFGQVLAVGAFNGRRVDATVAWTCWSLAVGTPNEDGSRGEVQIFYGDPASTMVVGPILQPGQDGLPGSRQVGDRFGAALVGYAFDEDKYHDLAIGAPGDGGGRVHLIPGSSAGLDTAHGTSFAQQTAEIEDDDLSGDELGAAVGAMMSGFDDVLVIGVPGEDANSGAIILLVVLKDPGTGAFFGAAPATILRPNDAGVQDVAQAYWGRVIAAPRAFPTVPAEYPL
jgi:hypothetical protein